MDRRWDIGATRDVLFELYGHEQMHSVLASVHSVWRRMEYARLHYQDAKHLADSYINQNLKEQPMPIVIYGNREQSETFNDFIYRAGAHVTAFTQNLHSVADIFGHALYYALELSRAGEPLEEWKIDARKVLVRLSRLPDVQRLANLLSEMLNGSAFRHLAALVNHSKHRALVLTSLTEDWSGLAQDRHRLRLDSFVHNKEHYPAVDVTGFLSNEWDRMYALGVDMGVELHAVLKNRLAARVT